MTFITAKRGGETDEKSSGKNDTGSFVSAPDIDVYKRQRCGLAHEFQRKRYYKRQFV